MMKWKSCSIGATRASHCKLCAFVLFIISSYIIFSYCSEFHFLVQSSLYVLPENSDIRVVVSITTFSTRINLTALATIENIMRDKFDRLMVTIPLVFRNASNTVCSLDDCVRSPDQSPSSVEDIVEMFELRFGPFNASVDKTVVVYKRERIYLQFLLTRDYGPATKLLGALLVERDPRTIIITLDDDVIYDAGFVRKLASMSPEHAALCPVCQFAFIDHKLRVVHDGSFIYWLTGRSAWYCPGWLMGVYGAAYRVGLFEDDVFDEVQSLSSNCLFNDDVWISGYLKKKGWPILVMPIFHGGAHTRHATWSLSAMENMQSTSLLECAQSYELYRSF